MEEVSNVSLTPQEFNEVASCVGKVPTEVGVGAYIALMKAAERVKQLKAMPKVITPEVVKPKK